MPSWDILSPPLHIFVFSSLLQEAVTAGSSDDFDVVPTNSLKKNKKKHVDLPQRNFWKFCLKETFTWYSVVVRGWKS